MQELSYAAKPSPAASSETRSPGGRSHRSPSRSRDAAHAANDLGLTTAVPARSTIHADTYPRTIKIIANSGDPKATAPVVYKLDFKRIAAKTAFWAGRPAMRVVQALSWFRDNRTHLEPIISGIVRRLSASPDRKLVGLDLRENIHAVPVWMYPAVERIVAEFLGETSSETKQAREHNAPSIH